MNVAHARILLEIPCGLKINVAYVDSHYEK